MVVPYPIFRFISSNEIWFLLVSLLSLSIIDISTVFALFLGSVLIPIPTKPSFAYYRPLRALPMVSAGYYVVLDGNSIPANRPKPDNMLLY